MLKHAATVASFIVLLALAGVFGAERAQAAATCGGKAATIVGTNAANVLVGTKHADVIVARGGADRVRGRGGEDVICAGPGNDYVDGGPRHDVVRGQVGHDTCVTSPGGGADLFVSCEGRTAFDLQMDDQLDWAWVEDAAGVRPLEGDNVTTTLRMGAGGVGHAGYRRTRVSPHGFVSGAATPLTFAELDDSRANVHLPFAMPFFGIRYHNVSVSTNGYVSFGAPAKDYMNDYQFTDFRGFNYVLGQYERGAMPYWSDLDLTNGGTGAGTVSVVKSTNRVAIKWDTGECCSGEPPHRKFQLVLFDDGRMRYDYISSTPPDSGPNPAFIGLSDGSGTRGLDSVGRSGFTFLRAEVTLPQSTLPVRSTAGFTMPGDVVLANQTIT